MLSGCIGVVKKEKKEEPKDVKVNPSTTTITGYLEDYLEVVDAEYTATNDRKSIFQWVVKVKVRAVKPFKRESEALSGKNDGPLYLDFCDGSGTPVSGFENLSSSYLDDAKLADVLRKGGGEVWISFQKYHDYGVEQYPEGLASFSISSKDDEKHEGGQESSSYDSGSEPSSSDSKDAGSGDYDRMLDDLEAYVDSYVKLYKKSKNGDASAIADYADAYEKAIDLQGSLKDAEGEMSTGQLARLMKIELKLAAEVLK